MVRASRTATISTRPLSLVTACKVAATFSGRSRPAVRAFGAQGHCVLLVLARHETQFLQGRMLPRKFGDLLGPHDVPI